MSIVERARQAIRGRDLVLVLPEGDDARIVAAAEQLAAENLARPVLIGQDNFGSASASRTPPTAPPPSPAQDWGEGSDGAPFCSLPSRGEGRGGGRRLAMTHPNYIPL